MATTLARLRQKLWADFRRLGRLLHRLQLPLPMIPGSFYRLRTKCGKPSCHCAHGQPHTAWVLGRSEQGKPRLYCVPAPDRPRIKRLTAEYRRFQRARAHWVKLAAQLLHQIDAIEARRVQPWPPKSSPSSQPSQPRSKP